MPSKNGNIREEATVLLSAFLHLHHYVVSIHALDAEAELKSLQG